MAAAMLDYVNIYLTWDVKIKISRYHVQWPQNIAFYRYSWCNNRKLGVMPILDMDFYKWILNKYKKCWINLSVCLIIKILLSTNMAFFLGFSEKNI